MVSDGSNKAAPPASPHGAGRAALLERHRWLAYVLPLAVFMLVGALEPKLPGPVESTDRPAVPYGWYPIIYTLKIVLTLLAVWLVWPTYRQFSFRISRMAVAVGVVGVLVWVGICRLQWEQRLLVPLGLEWLVGSGARSAFNPFEQLADYGAVWPWAFLAVRFFGLVVVVAVIEEFFLRGFLMRFVMQARWWEVPFGKVDITAILVGTLVPMLMHPAELFAAAVWFSMVTWLMVRTRSLWDCVAAHAITNLLLGIYVVLTGAWHLW